MFFSSPNISNRLRSPPVSYKMGTVVLSGMKRSKYDVESSSSRSAQVKNKWVCTSSLPIYLHVLDSTNSAFTLSTEVIVFIIE